ncbi:hypothetical protein BOTBODRAFT_28429 [Botryobasidium botryosum FD-172 SS1]|uniref:Symplekin C-terminal domain-containing protein n=1 Tax=Botryobasidium botryosum (strain FD-172 SS1) TaxID=930990 RepID=A0A067N5B3_BOTB1|nr:hypothetical protein BOTBODRAFT_28429 [Botryobasidium botryosum FD-172 SS1]
MTTGLAMDPLQTLTAALSVPSNSPEQIEILAALRAHLEAHVDSLPLLCNTLLQSVVSAEYSLFKQWVVDLFHYTICRSTLSLDINTQLCLQCLDVLVALLNDFSTTIVKVTIQCFGTVYPLVFRALCSNRHAHQQWEILSQAKARILAMFDSPITHPSIKLAALKFMHRVVVVQTRGITDPRRQNPADPNLSFCPSDHPFISATALESEGNHLVKQFVTLLYTSQNPDVISAILNSFGTLFKSRPPLLQVIVPTLTSWAPTALVGQSASNIRSIEKNVRILLTHIARSGHAGQFAHEISDALQQQTARMDIAAREEHERRAERKRAMLAAAASEPEAKRAKMEPPAPSTTGVWSPVASSHRQLPPQQTPQELLATFDFGALPQNLLIDLIIANLQTVSDEILGNAIQAYRQLHGAMLAPVPAPTAASVPPAVPASASASTQHVEPDATPDVTIKEEAIDPLKVDIDDDEMEYEPDSFNIDGADEGTPPLDFDGAADGSDAEDAIPLQLVNYTPLPPKILSQPERDVLVHSSISRICSSGEGLRAPVESEEDPEKEKSIVGLPSPEMWMLLLVRMITRGPEKAPESLKVEDSDMDGDDGAAARSLDTRGVGRVSDRDARQMLCDYVLADFSARVRLATVWMNEEWYNDRIRSASDPSWVNNYDIWLQRLLIGYQESSDAKDKTFTQFLIDLPSIPLSVLTMLQDLSTRTDQMRVGFATLSELVSLRPPLRPAAMKILLDLTTHPAEITRGAAIRTVRRWVPNVKPMGTMIKVFALQMLRRLETIGSRAASKEREMGEEEGEDALPAEVPSTPFLPEVLENPVEKAVVLQHVELLFALTVKIPELLDAIFEAYGQMDASVQAAIQELITPLMRSLGPHHGKLLTLLRTFPPKAETLALRVLTILTENGRPSAPLVALVKSLIAERELNARFLIPIIAEMDKADILRHLPKIVSVLDGKAEEKMLVKSVFGSVVTTQNLGAVSSNLPRVRQSELLTPAELMVLLHMSEKDIGIKPTIEAIGICFSMTEVFGHEILAVVMQQIVDQPVLPVLFLRTVIQAVTTYRSLIPFVSTTLLSRLITKKIWTNSQLWEGFIRCAKVIAPASFSALLQLPKEQLREIVDKQPSLKSGLREYVIKKAGNKTRVAGFLEVLSEDGNQSPAP